MRAIDSHSARATCITLAWAAVVLVLASRHVFWRDEVRALSLALQGENVLAMLRGVQGEGHPALWYLLLRGAHTLLPSPAVLPGVSILVAAAATILLAFRSPLRWPLVVLFLFGLIGVYEYSVMARNYGISMLLMFAFAALYPRHRDRGFVLGGILFLLVNANVHSVILAGAFLSFWLLEVAWPAPRPREMRNLALNAAIVALGIAVCAATVYPPFNDAAQSWPAEGFSAMGVARAVLLPPAAGQFASLAGHDLWRGLLEWSNLCRDPLLMSPALLGSALLFGSTLGLVQRPAALLATWGALLGLSGFFEVVYGGKYRHQALWLVFLVSMYWITGCGPSERHTRPFLRIVRTLGTVCLAALLGLQVYVGLRKVVLPVGLRAEPESRSRDLAHLITRTPELTHATVIADPDYLVEPLSYYVSNPTYLLREQRYGNVVTFTRNARLTLNLDDILRDARDLVGSTGRPVVILMAERLEASAPARIVREGYNWHLSTTPEQVLAFLDSTRRVARFEPVCCSDESYDVYVLR